MARFEGDDPPVSGLRKAVFPSNKHELRKPSPTSGRLSSLPRITQKSLQLGGGVDHEQPNEDLRWNHPGPEVDMRFSIDSAAFKHSWLL